MASLNDIETKIQNIIGILGTKTITGTLPLTFTAKAGAADTWTIYGNDDNGTENLWNNEIIQGTVNSTTGELIIGTTTRIRSSTYSPTMLAPGTYTVNATGVDKTMIFVYDSGYNYNRTASTPTWAALPYTFTINESFYYVEAFKFDDDSTITPDDISQIMLVKGSTAPDHYIPYQQGVGEQRQDGYYIPLTVSQQGQTDKTVDIYIGDSPLTEGETVSKQSTGVDVELFEGENTISTTLYNKPKMKINYKWR